MTQRPDDTRLHDWLDETVGQTPDPVEGTQQVMSQTEETSQVGRWLPFPVFHRKAKVKTPTATDTAEYQPSPIPALNGHTPTVIGRTTSMLSPVKAITAGALVFAIGGVLLIAQPFDQQGGSVPGAATEETSGEAVPFEGGMSYGTTSVRGVVETLPNGVVTNRGQIWTLSSAGLSDPRLQGTVSNMWNWDEFKAGQSHQIEVGGFRIENDGGAWQMRPVVSLLFPDDEYSVWTGIFDGEGDYEGLTAIAEVAEDNGFTVRGVIIEGEVPPAPDSMSTE